MWCTIAKSLGYYKMRKDAHIQMVPRTQLSFEVLIGPLLGGPPERKEYFEYNAMLSIRTVHYPMLSCAMLLVHSSA
jgi:hypothetical protein